MYEYTVKTNKTVEEVQQALHDTIASYQFGVLWELDLQETLKKKGIDHDQSSLILEVCNPKKAKELIDQNPLANLFLPCKIAVYEVDGVNTIGLPRPTVQAEMIGDEKLKEIAKEIETILIQLIDEVK
ncbi:Uncharacterized conserved protein, DUF302 family [Pelagirhabdus alkalitolerans]|uniref:Uncharacterized conserved protein, DUF302 family n=1 Tax=Pelagirhabdus alkalitolerans TaxID=1612202 RepID=A0A1G6KNF3_9BACI|nr:DUF302 domain-containing protein [Pelagirhabdus alkalitolerans]SDC32045.1 Uncharacterized conserved protein, DUF302 family [Pelagirhabdus alkalitolerans]